MHCVCYGAIPQVKRVKKEDGNKEKVVRKYGCWEDEERSVCMCGKGLEWLLVSGSKEKRHE